PFVQLHPNASVQSFSLSPKPWSKPSVSELDLNIDTGGEIELHQRVHRLRRRVNDIEKALMGAHLELLAALLVDVGGPVNRKLLDAGRKRNGAPDACAGALRRRHDLARRSIEDPVI